MPNAAGHPFYHQDKFSGDLGARFVPVLSCCSCDAPVPACRFECLPVRPTGAALRGVSVTSCSARLAPHLPSIARRARGKWRQPGRRGRCATENRNRSLRLRNQSRHSRSHRRVNGNQSGKNINQSGRNGFCFCRIGNQRPVNGNQTSVNGNQTPANRNQIRRNKDCGRRLVCLLLGLTRGCGAGRVLGCGGGVRRRCLGRGARVDARFAAREGLSAGCDAGGGARPVRRAGRCGGWGAGRGGGSPRRGGSAGARRGGGLCGPRR